MTPAMEYLHLDLPFPTSRDHSTPTKSSETRREKKVILAYLRGDRPALPAYADIAWLMHAILHHTSPILSQNCIILSGVCVSVALFFLALCGFAPVLCVFPVLQYCLGIWITQLGRTRTCTLCPSSHIWLKWKSSVR